MNARTDVGPLAHWRLCLANTFMIFGGDRGRNGVLGLVDDRDRLHAESQIKPGNADSSTDFAGEMAHFSFHLIATPPYMPHG